MASTDTVVGVIGAVVLVAAMGIVFVYEFNNTTAETGNTGKSGPDAKAAFTALYGDRLNATGDLDGDGLANFNDTDLDGNGVQDASQTGDFEVPINLSGSVTGATPPATQSTASNPFTLQQGARSVTGTFTYTTATPAPLAPTLQISVDGPADGCDGMPMTNGSPPTQATTVTRDVKVDPACAGTFTLKVYENGGVPGQAQAYSAKLVANYGPVVHPEPAKEPTK